MSKTVSNTLAIVLEVCECRRLGWDSLTRAHLLLVFSLHTSTLPPTTRLYPQLHASNNRSSNALSCATPQSDIKELYISPSKSETPIPVNVSTPGSAETSISFLEFPISTMFSSNSSSLSSYFYEQMLDYSDVKINKNIRKTRTQQHP